MAKVLPGFKPYHPKWIKSGPARGQSPDGNKLFEGPMPAGFATALKKQPGTWKQVFGADFAEEAFTTYYVAKYIDAVSRAGREAYPLPTYENVWMGGAGTNGPFYDFDGPGDGYPSGGAGHLPPVRRHLPDHPFAVRLAGLQPDEFLVMGFDSEIDFRPPAVSRYKEAKFVQVEEGVYEDGVWKPVKPPSAASPARGLKLPNEGAMGRVKLEWG